MLRATGTKRDGEPVFLLGLTDENLERLRAGQPISVELAEMIQHPADADVRAEVVIFYAGESAVGALHELAALVHFDEVKIDPRLIPDAPPED